MEELFLVRVGRPFEVRVPRGWASKGVADRYEVGNGEGGRYGSL